MARKIAKGFFGFLFTFCLVIAILLGSLTQFTEYNSLKLTVSDFIARQLVAGASPQDISALYTGLKATCQTQDTIELPLALENVTIKCSELESTSQENFVNLISAKLFDKIYYKKYDCQFIKCLQNGGYENYLVVVSEHANNFFESIQIFVWLATGIFGSAFVLAIETLAGRLKGLGISLLVTSIPFFALTYFIQFLLPSSQFVSGLSPQVVEMIGTILNPLFNSMTRSYVVVLIAGIILTVSGFLLARRQAKQNV